MKYRFVFNNRKNYPIERLLKVLNIRKSGYYKWLSRTPSKREIENDKILSEIKAAYLNSRGMYGSPRVYKCLHNKGIKCGKNRVVRLMKENQIVSKTRKKYKTTTNSRHNNPVYENILDRRFQVDKPNKVWVSDITYIWTDEGWLYLCVIIDLYSRKVVGWAMREWLDNKLVISAFSMAYLQRKPNLDTLLFHSDQGIQYTSKDFQKILKNKKVLCSMSRKGNCWDNACAESFFHTLKAEEVQHFRYYTRESAKVRIFDYIERFYNNSRMHSYLGYMNPTEFENKRKSA